MANKAKQALISKEKARLRKRYETLPKESLDIVQGLIDRAAYLRVALDEMEDDMDTNGRVEPFTQSERTPTYDRERPVVRQYVSFNREYHNVTKTLDDKLPKAQPKPADDGFADFASERENE